MKLRLSSLSYVGCLVVTGLEGEKGGMEKLYCVCCVLRIVCVLCVTCVVVLVGSVSTGDCGFSVAEIPPRQGSKVGIYWLGRAGRLDGWMRWMDLVHRWMDVGVDGGSIAADSSRQAADSGRQSVREREER